MPTSAVVLARSRHANGPGAEVTTFQLRYPKFIHGEAKTHRVMSNSDEWIVQQEVGLMDEKEFSRNASSSRAIPVERLIQDVMDDPVIPLKFFKNKKGMQGTEEVIGVEREMLVNDWLDLRNQAVATARVMMNRGVHKQHVNRALEPWCHINVVVTATDLKNFFLLRRHADAQPEMKHLADLMWDAYQKSPIDFLSDDEWHLPYVDEPVMWDDETSVQNAIRTSVARCARVSYMTHDGKVASIEQELKLYDMLVSQVPLHASPAEHQCKPDVWRESHLFKQIGRWGNPELHGNLHGFIQFRQLLDLQFIPG